MTFGLEENNMRKIKIAKIGLVEKGGFSRRQFVVTGTKGMVELKPFKMLLCILKIKFKLEKYKNNGKICTNFLSLQTIFL